MPLELSKETVREITPSLRRFLAEELDVEIGEMQANFLLDYILKEISPFAYNKGVKDAEAFLRAHLEDLRNTCFEEELTFWKKRRK